MEHEEKRGRGPGRPPGRCNEGTLVYVYTAPGGELGHRHVAIFDEAGDGITTEGPDGHVHVIRGLDLDPSDGHSHGLSCQRAPVVDYRRYLDYLRRTGLRTA
jgi:hypothetical protein